MERLQQHSMFFGQFEYYSIFTLAQKISLKNHPSKSFRTVKESLSEVPLGFRLLVPSTFAAVRQNGFHLWDLTWMWVQHGEKKYTSSTTRKKTSSFDQLVQHMTNIQAINSESRINVPVGRSFPLSNYFHLFNDHLHAMATSRLLCTKGWGVITWAITWSCPFEGDDVDMENEKGWINRFGW